jgi:hypothetical protein
VFSNLSNTAKVSELLKLGAKRHVLKAELGPMQLLDLVHEEIDAAENTSKRTPSRPLAKSSR